MRQFYYGSGSVINYGSGSCRTELRFRLRFRFRQKVKVPTVPVPQHCRKLSWIRIQDAQSIKIRKEPDPRHWYEIYLGGRVWFAGCGGMADLGGGGDHGEVPRLHHGGDQEPGHPSRPLHTTNPSISYDRYRDCGSASILCRSESRV